MLKKLFRPRKLARWQIHEKETIEEIIFRTIKAKGIAEDQRIFPISYTAARGMVRKAGTLLMVHLRPHDLRRQAAIYAFGYSRGNYQ
jgi:integrase